MAEMLVTDGWVRAGSVGAYLNDTLGEAYFVLADPLVRGQRAAAAVVGRTGVIFVASLEENGGENGHAPETAGGDDESIRDAFALFLKDEFPSLRPNVKVIGAARDWSEQLATWRVMEPPQQRDLLLADAIVAEDGGEDAFASDAEREALAVALRDRQLTISQRASQPFVFRGGGRLRVGTRAWTVREAVQHMDRHPEDGIHHLRNGTLAGWLEDEGAHHLAALAKDVVGRPRLDMQGALELFLIGTGAVARPGIVARPSALDLGYVIQGSCISRVLRLGKGRSRGFLFGELKTTEPWLNIEPREFRGASEVVVTADTENLVIDPQPREAEVLVLSTASEEPVSIPVRVKVVAMPAAASKVVFRPLAGFLSAAAIGFVIGLLWRAAGIGAPDAAVLGADWFWPLLLAAVWGLAGLLRGAEQPAAWPIRYALRRWLIRAAVWSFGLALLALALAWAWSLGLGGGLSIPGLRLLAVALVGAAFGFMPATLDELAHSRHTRGEGYVYGRRSRRRSAVLGGAAVVFVLVALLAPRLISSVAQRAGTEAAVGQAQGWMAERVEGINRSVDDLVDRWTLQQYDRRSGAGQQGGIKLPSVKDVLGGK